MWPNWQRATVMEKADFLQEGAQGLLRAIRLFDTARGVRFSTYASWHVRAFVLRALRDKSHLVRLPQTGEWLAVGGRHSRRTDTLWPRAPLLLDQNGGGEKEEEGGGGRSIRRW